LRHLRRCFSAARAWLTRGGDAVDRDGGRARLAVACMGLRGLLQRIFRRAASNGAALATRTGERDAAVAALRDSDAQYRFLVENIEDFAIYMLDPHGRITNWNRGGERIKGYTPEEAIGRDFSMFFTREEQRAGEPARILERAAHDGKFEAEAWRVRKDGSRFWASVVVDPLRDQSGKLVGFAKITRDITQRLQQKIALDKAREQLAAAQRLQSIGELTGGIAHDFNNLLTTIIGSLDVMERRHAAIDGDIRRLLGAARHAAERGAALTDRLLSFARRQALEPRVLDFNRLIAGMEEVLRRTLGETTDIEVVQAGGLWRGLADSHQLESALLNLAINARDAMPKGGKITIETANVFLDEEYAAAHAEVKPGQYVMLGVTDTGTGMPADVLEHAFEPFFTTKPEGRGTGLGLSQVFGFVKQSGGHIKLYSEPGQGTTVKIYLPRHDGEEEPGPPPLAGNVAHLAHGETVLFVEDDDGVRDYGIYALKLLGYRVLNAATGAAALKLLDAHPEVSLLFTDVGLPDLNGRKLAEEAQRRRPGLKVLYTTGYARNAIVHNGLVDPGVEVLAKPFTVERLGRKLREVIREK
jgi:PAS domain S-box-containing protein